MARRKMTAQGRQREDMLRRIYEFLDDFDADRGFCPSHREIADACFISRSSVTRYLDLLEARGLLEREPGTARGIRIVRDETMQRRWW